MASVNVLLVGWKEALGFRPTIREVGDVSAAFTGTVDPSTLPIASPWSSSHLQRLMLNDIFGTDVPVLNDRASAMRLPAIARGRNLIVSSISDMPLIGLAGATPLAKNPSWMTSWDGGQSPQARLAWTVDDLIFYGWSCWWRRNAAKSDGGFPLGVQRVNQGDWEIDTDTRRVLVNGKPAEDDEVILIPGLHEGILSFGADVLKDARNLYTIVRNRLISPLPPLDLHQESGRELTDDEIDTLLDRYEAARQAGRTVSFSSQHIRLNPLTGTDDGQLMIEARNAASLDLARLIGVTAGMLDATAPKATLNYETKLGRNQEFVDRDLKLYMTPIWARLSADDVMPHGQRCGFDTSGFTLPDVAPTGPVLED